MNDRSERTMILGPLALLLKQRTVIASILSASISMVMFYFGSGPIEVAVLTSPLLLWIGGQKYLDSQEMASKASKEYYDLFKAVMELSNGVQKIEELEILFEEVLDVIELHVPATESVPDGNETDIS